VLTRFEPKGNSADSRDTPGSCFRDVKLIKRSAFDFRRTSVQFDRLPSVSSPQGQLSFDC